MNSAVLLAEENRQLRHENERQKKKRAKKRTFIATRGVLTIQEGIIRQDMSQVINTVLESGVVTEEATVKPRAPEDRRLGNYGDISDGRSGYCRSRCIYSTNKGNLRAQPSYG
jgi:hypothetical protein